MASESEPRKKDMATVIDRRYRAMGVAELRPPNLGKPRNTQKKRTKKTQQLRMDADKHDRGMMKIKYTL